MSLLLLAKKFPRYFIAAAIFIGSLGIFLLWMITGGGKPPAEASKIEVKQPLAAFNPEEVVLCGNKLVQIPTGEILTEEWIKGIGGSSPNIAGVLPEKELVILAGNGRIFFYGMDGKAKPPVSVDGRPAGRIAFNRGDFKVVYVKDGNLWMGEIDLETFAVKDSKQVTNVGYFKDERVFQFGWHWTGNNLFISIQARPHLVLLNTGEIRQEGVDVNMLAKHVSPDGKISVIPVGGGFAVLDLEEVIPTRFPLAGGEVRQILWLNNRRVAVRSYTHLEIYDREKKAVVASLQQPGQQIQAAVAKSPDGNLLLASTTKGAHLIDIGKGSFKPVSLPMDVWAFISNDTLLCSNASTETAVRGIWKVGVSGEAERIFERPADVPRGGGAAFVPTANGAAFVSSGDLWVYDADSTAPRQLTQTGGVSPPLQLLCPSSP